MTKNQHDSGIVLHGARSFKIWFMAGGMLAGCWHKMRDARLVLLMCGSTAANCGWDRLWYSSVQSLVSYSTALHLLSRRTSCTIDWLVGFMSRSPPVVLPPTHLSLHLITV